MEKKASYQILNEANNCEAAQFLSKKKGIFNLDLNTLKISFCLLNIFGKKDKNILLLNQNKWTSVD